MISQLLKRYEIVTVLAGKGTKAAPTRPEYGFGAFRTTGFCHATQANQRSNEMFFRVKPPLVAAFAVDGVTKTGSDKGVNPSFEAFVCAVTKANLKLKAASRDLEPTTL